MRGLSVSRISLAVAPRESVAITRASSSGKQDAPEPPICAAGRSLLHFALALPSWMICALRLANVEVGSVCVEPSAATISAATLIADGTTDRLDPVANDYALAQRIRA